MSREVGVISAMARKPGRMMSFVYNFGALWVSISKAAESRTIIVRSDSAENIISRNLTITKFRMLENTLIL